MERAWAAFERHYEIRVVGREGVMGRDSALVIARGELSTYLS